MPNRELTEEKIMALPTSELLLLMLRDIEGVERTEGMFINMSHWNVKSKLTGNCAVCAAGAVFVKSLGAPLGDDSMIYNRDLASRLNLLRDGLYVGSNGREDFTLDYDYLFEIEVFSEYEENRDDFFDAITKWATKLKELGK